MIVRQAQAGDLLAMLAVEREGMSPPWSAGQLESELCHPASRVFIAELDGSCAGYIAFRVSFPEAEMLRLVVSPVQRHKGVGGNLMRSGLHTLAESGLTVCFLEVRQSNEVARALYRRFGFIRIGKRPGYYRDPREEAVVMQCDM